MAIHPPWNDTVTVIGANPSGEPEYNRQGDLITTHTRETECRVKYSGQRLFTARGDETVAKLELQIPEDFPIKEGEKVRWVDQHGETIETEVAVIKEVLDYPGVVQYRKVWTE